MSIPNSRLLAVLSVLGLSAAMVTACAPQEEGSVESVPDVTISNIASPTDPIATSPPTSSADKDVPEEGLPPTEIVNILVDTSEGSVQQAAVPLGSPVNIRVRSTSDDEFHLHGYDLDLTGTDVLFTFTADRLGEFLLEAHGSGKQLLILTVFED